MQVKDKTLIRKYIEDKEKNKIMKKLLLILPFLLLFNCEKDNDDVIQEMSQAELLVGKWTEEFAPELNLWTLLEFKADGEYKLSLVDENYELVQQYHQGTWSIDGDQLTRSYDRLVDGTSYSTTSEFFSSRFVLLISASEYARVSN